jgi:RNA-binding protein NOB1
MSWANLAASKASTPAPKKQAAALEAVNDQPCLVIDSGAIISGFKLDKYGPDAQYVTIPEVLAEIKDKKARHFLDTFPYELRQRAVSEKAFATVCEFARRTGDFHSLSRVDLKVLALAYMLECEINGSDNLRSEPAQLQVADHTPPPQAPTPAPATSEDAAGGDNDDDDDDVDSDDDEAAGEWITEDNFQEGHDIDRKVGTDVAAAAEKEAADAAAAADADADGAGDEDGDDEAEVDDDKDASKAEAAAAKVAAASSPMPAASTSNVMCITTDYAMQNVLLQMGLRLLSVNGLSVTTLRHFFKRCHACRYATRDMAKRFCDRCGNHTLIKVHCWVDARGVSHQRWSNRTIYNKRGTQYSVKRPTGGRRGAANDLMLRPDMTLEQDKHDARKEKDYDPFRDATEFGFEKAGAKHNFNKRFGHGYKNVNANKKKTGNRKKKTKY